MNVLPEDLKRFAAKAKKYLEEGRIKEIEFSGGTYQVQIIDIKTNKPVWAFLQLNNRGKIKDSFCSCEEGEEIHHCEHQAAAFLRIYNGHSSPLHHRFERSLWNNLCRLFAEQLGYSPSILEHSGKGSYRKEDHFKIKAKSIQKIDDIVQHRKKETEETSLKFSNLSLEEIEQWKEGRPSSHLSYELSFWNDIAKWFMLLQDEGVDYEISFKNPTKLPDGIEIHFPTVDAYFALSPENLARIVPSLTTVKSPLAVHHTAKEDIKKIIYDKERGCFKIIHHMDEKQKRGDLQKGIEFDGWIYVPNDGFYSSSPDLLLSSKELCGSEIELAFNTHLQEIRELLEGTVLHMDSIHLSFAISFDPDWNLHISPYVFHPGDMANSRRFGNWIYIDDEGFYRLENLPFEIEENVILAPDVATFVSQNRSWLNTQEGFQTHISNVETYLTYSLSDDNRLTFGRKLALADEFAQTKDFGRWIYISGQGFFSKTSVQAIRAIPPGLVINADQIPIFIRAHREDLNLIPRFFSDTCPVEKAALNVSLLENECVQVTPEYLLLPQYRGKDVRFFEDVVYTQEEGFFQLPGNLRLPENYRHTTWIEPKHIEDFLKNELPTLKNFVATLDPRLIAAKDMQLIASSISKAERGFYHLKLKYETDKGEIPIAQIWNEYHRKKNMVFSTAGLIYLSERRFQWIKQLKKDRLDRRSNTITLSTLELLKLNAFENIEIPRTEDANTSRQLFKELIELHPPEEPNLEGLKSVLRPYQKIGVQWLWFLYHYSLSGLLCDDMGLGKTHQTMALFQAIHNFHQQQREKKRVHFLVVCPTSVIYHWKEKLQDFLPHLYVSTFYGLKRNLETFYEECDILLTSYGVWRNESEELSKLNFEVAVFDEVQIAKNYHSRIHAALLKANAKMRLGLTGTPIENHLRELKSLFDIVLPSYMPPERDYKEFFVNPIEKDNDQQRKFLLSRLIKPFVLRRKKETVLFDLPLKTEEIAHCDLMPDQRQMYIDVLTASRERLITELEDDKNAVPYIHIFALLSHLKQICDHPAVFLKKPQEYKHYQSGKWELFIELLNEARDSQQKVVVYSQYLAMLDIIENHLTELGINYASIRGATINRGQELQKFNQDPKCEVFVGSLQAAGLGVDLTAASVVIHYDRWWNAARENQATDRVHRIGQTRGVQVFKLMAKDTLEEHIDTLITRKGKLMEDIVSIDDHQLIKKFERKELIHLLKMLPS